jgi:hypothetical protein
MCAFVVGRSAVFQYSRFFKSEFRLRPARPRQMFSSYLIPHEGGGLSRFDFDTPSIGGTTADPTIDTTPVVSNLKTFPLRGLDQVKVFPTIYFAKNDVTNVDFVVSGKWCHRA